MKPHAPACDRNREPILSVIGPILKDHQAVLEIGSGTGQHAIYFAEAMPHLNWHASDLTENHGGIRAWLEESDLPNVHGPLHLDVGTKPWQVPAVDVVFTANSMHIMSWELVQELLAGVGDILPVGGSFLAYGPFNYNGQFTSESNARFELWLKNRDARSGIRDFEGVVEHSEMAGMKLIEDYEMPANNRLLHFKKN